MSARWSLALNFLSTAPACPVEATVGALYRIGMIHESMGHKRRAEFEYLASLGTHSALLLCLFGLLTYSFDLNVGFLSGSFRLRSDHLVCVGSFLVDLDVRYYRGIGTFDPG